MYLNLHSLLTLFYMRSIEPPSETSQTVSRHHDSNFMYICEVTGCMETNRNTKKPILSCQTSRTTLPVSSWAHHTQTHTLTHTDSLADIIRTQTWARDIVQDTVPQHWLTGQQYLIIAHSPERNSQDRRLRTRFTNPEEHSALKFSQHIFWEIVSFVYFVTC